MNERIVTVNREKQLNISPVTKEEIQSTEFTELFKTLEKKDQKLVKNINDEIKKIDISPQITLLNKRVFTPQDSKVEAERAEMKRILTETIANSYSLVSTKLNDIYIDPNTTGAEDKDKLFINLHIEMEEEGLRIKSITDKNGQPVEEIIFE